MSTIDPEEIERFSRIAAEWWNPHGKFKPLHVIAPLRIGYVQERILSHYGVESLSGLSLLDIGCGGGLIAEPMARLGASVTAIDASAKNIGVANLHAEQSGLTIDYRCTSAEQLLETGAQYDVVLSLEVIEHVANPAEFVRCCFALTKPGGVVIFSTINRTTKAFALAIVGAEYVLRWLPRGTHTFEKFIKPSEFASWIRASGGEVQHMTGMVMNPLSFEWRLDAKDVGVNYFMSAAKPAPGGA
jgi:2-polyprenyl-6-hydroxyphenyl methylase/3-demethylubiquinone-9 3-methyltransferase